MNQQRWILYQRDAIRLGKRSFEEFVQKQIGQWIPKAIARSASSDTRTPAPLQHSSIHKPPKRHRVGIWDINSLAGDIGVLASTLNTVQDAFWFFEVSGAVPAALISDRERIFAWAEQAHFRLNASQRLALEDNTIAEHFYPQARKLRKQLGLQYIIGITRSMIAFVEDGDLYTNYFASAAVAPGREMLVSSYDLRQYAVRANRPLEAALGNIAISILLATISPRVEYHEDTGCLFDFNADRDSIVESIRETHIEDDCLKKISPKARLAANAMAQALRSMPFPTETLPKGGRKPSK